MDSIGIIPYKTPVLLFPNGVPNAKKPPSGYFELVDNDKVSMVTNPTITPYFPESNKANGSAVVICPGGSYAFLSIEHEGNEVARKFTEIGVTAFVLKYRLPSDKIMEDRSIGPLQDAQRAIQIIRQNALEWGIDQQKIGIAGFSAGGHLASTAGTHFNIPVIANVPNISLQPDFMILLYPVISFGEHTHQTSRNNLTGDDTMEAKLDFFSNEKHVTNATPPSFLMHAADDNTVPVQNSLLFYEALIKNEVKAELHIYQAGGHGFGLHNKTAPDCWFNRCTNWLQQNGFLGGKIERGTIK